MDRAAALCIVGDLGVIRNAFSASLSRHKRASGKSRMVTATRRLSVSPRAVATRRMLDGATHIPSVESSLAGAADRPADSFCALMVCMIFGGNNSSSDRRSTQPKNTVGRYYGGVSGLAPIAESPDIQITTAAYHEAGHIVVAAALGLSLRPEGIMVGQDAKGLACYWKEPDRTDASVEANILASFAGFYAEKRLRAISGSQARDYFAVIWSTDWKEARALEGKFSLAYLGNRNIHAVNDEL